MRPEKRMNDISSLSENALTMTATKIKPIDVAMEGRRRWDNVPMPSNL